mgnify:CR=1 FL=1
MIPKIIHYCWLSNDPIPEKLQICMNSWKEKLPDYQFILWDTQRFDVNSTPWVSEAFKARKYAFAADYIRLYAVYHYGGIYLDMDVEVVKPFSKKILTGNYLIGYESSNYTIGIEAGIFGGEPKAEWLYDCLKYYEGRHFIKSDGSFDILPLPRIIWRIIKNKYIDTGIIKPLPPDFLTAKCCDNGKIKKTSNTYTIHHFEGSWFTPKQKIKRIIIRILGAKIMSFIRKKHFLFNQ